MQEPRIHRRACAPLAALALIAAAGCATGDVPERMDVPPVQPAATSEELMRLGPNDVVRASVHGHPELSTPETAELTGARVDPDGALSLPLVGPVAVGGMTLPEAREAVTAAYAKYVKEPRLDLSVVQYAARRFYLYGEVNQPGAYEMDRPLNAYEALSFGRGFEPQANRAKIVLLRETEDDVVVHIIDGETPDASGLVAIQPDDFIFVRRSGVGKFSEEVLPVLQGISSSLSSVATLILIEDRVSED